VNELRDNAQSSIPEHLLLKSPVSTSNELHGQFFYFPASSAAAATAATAATSPEQAILPLPDIVVTHTASAIPPQSHLTVPQRVTSRRPHRRKMQAVVSSDTAAGSSSVPPRETSKRPPRRKMQAQPTLMANTDTAAASSSSATADPPAGTDTAFAFDQHAIDAAAANNTLVEITPSASLNIFNLPPDVAKTFHVKCLDPDCQDAGHRLGGKRRFYQWTIVFPRDRALGQKWCSYIIKNHLDKYHPALKAEARAAAAAASAQVWAAAADGKVTATVVGPPVMATRLLRAPVTECQTVAKRNLAAIAAMESPTLSLRLLRTAWVSVFGCG
jgi:hypothetical protein